MKLDVLAFGAHPDDIELACSGSLMKLIAEGKSVGIVDLTEGEMGTRGSIFTRREESANASKIIGIAVRENLNLGDSSFELNQETRVKVIEVIRKYRPTIVLANAVDDRHIDHPKGAQLVKEAFFLSGLSKIVTSSNNEAQMAFRPKFLFHYIQHYHTRPDFVIDITGYQSRKIESILAYKTQFYNPDSKEAETPISSKRFLNFLDARSREMGEVIGVEYGEGFTSHVPLSYDFKNLL
jgi:bacillithiol biosynthesis deacetylase BshB1